MNYRDTAWLRDAHDRAECPDLCPWCSREEAVCDQEERGPRDFYVTTDWEER